MHKQTNDLRKAIKAEHCTSSYDYTPTAFYAPKNGDYGAIDWQKYHRDGDYYSHFKFDNKDMKGKWKLDFHIAGAGGRHHETSMVCADQQACMDAIGRLLKLKPPVAPIRKSFADRLKNLLRIN